MGRLPLLIQKLFGQFLGFLLYAFMSKRRKYVFHNLSKAFPSKGKKEISTITKDHFIHLGHLVYELLSLPALSVKVYRDRKLTFKGIEKINKTLAHDKAAMVLTAHMGNWEIMTTMASLIDRPFSALYKEQKSIWDEIMTHLRTCSGLQVIPNKRGLKGIIRSIRNNELIGVLADQGRKGMTLNFFGSKATFPSGAATFYVKHGVVPFPVFGTRQNDGRTLVEVLDPVVLSEEEQSLPREEQEMTFLKKYIAILERQINIHPEQYYWVHDVWRDFKGD